MLKDMSLSIEEKKEQMEPTAITERADYPHGLKLYLDEETVKKLALDKLPSVNETMTLLAKVEVVGVNSEKGEDDQRRHSLQIQITDMELASGSPSKEQETDNGKSAAETLFGG